MNTSVVNSQFQRHIDQALLLTKAGDYAQANALLLEAVTLEPSSAIPHFLLGANYAENGQTDLAEGAFVSTLTRAPDFVIARFQLGLLQLTAGRAAAAMATWEPLSELEPRSYIRRFVEGFLEIIAGNFDEAETCIKDGIALNDEKNPLNGDMQGVLERLRKHKQGLPDDAAAAEAESSSREDVSQHFLVGGYRAH